MEGKFNVTLTQNFGFQVVSLGIFSVATDRTMCPGVDSASKNDYQVFLLW